MLDIEYLTDKNGEPKAVVIPMELWRKIMPKETENLDNLSDSLEDYCLNQAMNEAKITPLLDKQSALKFLEEDLES